MITLALLSLLASDPAWATAAPAQLPPVTVRWLDHAQQETLLVQGARYECRLETLPLKITALRVDGQELLPAGGTVPTVVDAAGRRLTPAPADLLPAWDVWRGQRWQPATSARARMNVWNAGPYYWDAHLLDIPLLAPDEVAKYQAPLGPPLRTFDVSRSHEGWGNPHNVTLSRGPDCLRLTLTGEDPYLSLPACDLPGPVKLTVRLRTDHGGGGAVYYGVNGQPIDGQFVLTFPVNGDSAWHEYAVNLGQAGQRITALRFDPPGEAGVVDVAEARLSAVPRAEERPAPARGELVLHAQPDRLALELRVDPVAGRPAPQGWQLDLGSDLSSVSAGGQPLATVGGAALLGGPGVTLTGRQIGGRLSGARPGAWVVLRPTAGRPATEAMADDLRPLADSAAQVSDGHWLGYDPIAGFYRAVVDREGSAFSFDPAFHNPTRRMQLGLRLTGDQQRRQVLVRVAAGNGNLEAAALVDAHGFLLPTAAFVCKNFAGEREEPDDTGYGDVYFPLSLAPGEVKSCTVQPLTANWGIWPLKQVSSIRFFLIYWHCSTGPSETTCWSIDSMTTKNAYFQIPDFRPLSGPFWPGQPQHDCQHWPGWLQYNDLAGKLIYEQTTFDSIAPSLARFTMHYHTSDQTAKAKVEVVEVPQRDEMRTLVRLRYDWVKPLTITGDARRSFRWLNMSHFRGRNAELLWTAPDGSTARRAVPAKDDFVLLGEPMSPQAPFMASEGPGEKYGVVTLVQRFKARLGGREYDRPAVSAAFDAKDASAWLTVAAQQLVLQPGDYLEAEVLLMPHGEPSPAGFKAARERRRYGLEPLKLTVKTGTKVGDYPPQVRASNEVAAFRVEGGHGDVPLLVDGLSGWKLPLLWINGVWQDHQVHGGDGYQVQPDGAGGYRATFIAPHRDQQAFEALVTRASCTTDITTARDRNGRLELLAGAVGDWTLQAPAPFAPGTNNVRPGAPTISFQGRAAAVRQVPLEISAAQPVDVSITGWDAQAVQLRSSAAATLTVGGLRPGGSYRVTVAGQTSTRVATGGSLQVTVPAAGEVSLTAP
ncbi:MAG: hypothetical protein IT204_04650 [Fimbriimonadaceae bacterium]|nr:hypothetical protein [Fimbriimonadaceae bacterium]